MKTILPDGRYMAIVALRNWEQRRILVHVANGELTVPKDVVLVRVVRRVYDLVPMTTHKVLHRAQDVNGIVIVLQPGWQDILAAKSHMPVHVLQAPTELEIQSKLAGVTPCNCNACAAGFVSQVTGLKGN